MTRHSQKTITLFQSDETNYYRSSFIISATRHMTINISEESITSEASLSIVLGLLRQGRASLFVEYKSHTRQFKVLHSYKKKYNANKTIKHTYKSLYKQKSAGKMISLLYTQLNRTVFSLDLDTVRVTHKCFNNCVMCRMRTPPCPLWLPLTQCSQFNKKALRSKPFYFL